MNEKTKNIVKNIVYAFSAQGISLILSVLMSLMVPKLLGIEEYGYWQLFLFYSGYTSFFHFGLNDGMYLRLGGKNYKDINFSLLGAQLKIMSGVQVLISIFVTVAVILFMSDPNRQFVIIATGIYLVIYNASAYIGYIFQAVNQTRVYSVSVMVDRAIFMLSILVLLIFRTGHFEYFILLYLISKSIALVYCILKGRDVIFSKLISIKFAVKEIWINMSVGIKLLIANIASALILGSGRLVIDAIWGIRDFGKLSFSISLANFFLLFISQVSMVIFPALRQTNTQQQKKVYYFVRDMLSMVLPVVFLAYIPMSILVGKWLPQYSESLRYLALLLPLCTFDGKMQLLCNTYFKVLRKEKILLAVNLFSMVTSFVLSLIGGYIFNSIYAIVVFMVVAIAFRSIISELYLAKIMESNITISLVLEIFLAALFMISTWFLGKALSFTIIAVFYVLFLYYNKSKLISINIFTKNLVGKA